MHRIMVLVVVMIVFFISCSKDRKEKEVSHQEMGVHGMTSDWKFTLPQGDPIAGRKVFVEVECYKCHEVKGEQFSAVAQGEKGVGPELSQMAGMHPVEFFAESIINPNAAIDPKGKELGYVGSALPFEPLLECAADVVFLVLRKSYTCLRKADKNLYETLSENRRKDVAQFVLTNYEDLKRMHCRQIKGLLIIILSATLLYYGVAWAVLSCFHEEAPSSIDEMSEGSLHQLEPKHAHADLECSGPNYHTDSMAVSSPTSRLDRLTPNGASDVKDFWTLRAVTGDKASDLWLRAAFGKFRLLSFLVGLPHYLSLSILRI